MSDQQYIKGACVHCNGRIEFPAAAAGHSIPCPHCQRTTPLTIPGAPAAAPVVAVPAPAPVAPSGNLKCSCSHCGGRIEFPANAAGLTVACPHCARQTVLAVPPPPPGHAVTAVRAMAPAPLAAAPAPAAKPKAAMAVARPTPPPAPVAEEAAPVEASGGKSKGLMFAIIGVVCLALIGGGVMVVLKMKKGGAAKTDGTEAGAKKGGTGLELVRYELQKAKEGGLVYVVGSVTNHSDQQFFQLKVEFEVQDKGGQSLGTATDTYKNIGPHADWSFRALIFEEGATQVKLGSFTWEK